MKVKSCPSPLHLIAIASFSVFSGSFLAHAAEQDSGPPNTEPPRYTAECVTAYHQCLLLNRDDTEDSLAIEHQRLTDKLSAAQARLRSLQSELTTITDDEPEETATRLSEEIVQIENQVRTLEEELLHFEDDIREMFEDAKDPATAECSDNLRVCQEGADSPSKRPAEAEIPPDFYDLELWNPYFEVSV